MSATELHSHITAVPFEPFHLRTADGRRVPVTRRDFILVTPTGRHAYVFHPDDSRDVLDVRLILGIEFASPPPSITPDLPPAATNP